MFKPLVYSCILGMALVASCKKPPATPSSVCKSRFFGYKGVYVTTADSFPQCTFGVIDKMTTSAPTIALFRNTVHANQGAYDTADLCYYTFKYYTGGSVSVLYKINLEGKVTELKSGGFYYKYEGLVYNRFNNKLYAIRRNINAYGITISEISFEADKYVTNDVLKDNGFTDYYSYISAAVNNTTGDIFFQLGSSATYNILKYHPGDTMVTRISKSSRARMFGLCFNPNDNMLYGITQDSLRSRFVKMSVTGDSVTIDTLSFRPDAAYYSATFDRCANEYIIAGKVTDTTGYFVRLNMAGAVISKDTIKGIYQSITVAD